MSYDGRRTRATDRPGERLAQYRSPQQSQPAIGAIIGCPAAAALVVALLMLLAIVVGRIYSQPVVVVAPTGAPRPGPVATAPRSTPAALAPSQATATSQSTPPPTVTPVPSPTEVSSIRVVHAGGDGVFLRPTPAAPEALGTISDGSIVTIIGPTVVESGRPWTQIRTDSGLEGWVAASFLLVPGTPSPTANGD